MGNLEQAAEKKPLIVLTGPTAVGKTALSIQLARRIGGEIISADSMQVYRHMDIGTAKIRLEEMDGVPHHLIDILEPTEDFNVVRFQALARAAAEDIYSRGKIPIVAGGTGFYIQALLNDIDFTQIDENTQFREEMERLAAEQGAEVLHERLRAVDPESAEAIHANNVKRVIRALEYYEQTGEKISAHNEAERAKTSPYHFFYYVLNTDRTVLYERIEKRNGEMMAEGLVEEVRQLQAMGCRRDSVAMQGLGYKEILAYLNGEMSLETAVNILKRDTRHFAKRQLTWFRRERDVRFLYLPEFDNDRERVLEHILQENGIKTERIAKDLHRPNLLAAIHAPRAEKEPVVLISHIDVVPGIQEEWTHPVFGAQKADGRIFGRGTLDTKQLTMMELYAFLNLKKQENHLNRDVYFLATIDEEAGSSFGMEYVRQERPNLFQNAMVINEGGGFPLHINGKNYMMLTVGEKAVCKIKISAEGTGGHASAPGENQALLKLAEGLRRIFAAEKELTCGSRRTWETMRRIVGSDSWDNATGADIFAYASQNSIGMRKYKIGECSNVIPAHVEAVLEFKVLPYGSQEEIETFVRKQIAGLPLEMEVLSYEAGFESNFENSHLKQLVNDLEEACRRFGFDGGVLPMLALGRTDGRFFGSAGSMVYGCSPLLMGDSFDAILPKVHGKDESILETSYEFGAQVLDEVIQKNCLKEERKGDKK